MDSPFAILLLVAIALGAIVFMVSVVQANKRAAAQKRREDLLAKYKYPEVVDLILRGMMWQGQTEEQLLDSLGPPVAVDNKLLKTKKRDVWKYGHTGANRYSLRVTVENGVVVGWEQKQ